MVKDVTILISKLCSKRIDQVKQHFQFHEELFNLI
jgi:hypothetical protein